MTVTTDRIRALNDQLRTTLRGGGAFITPGVAALGADSVKRLLQVLSVYDDFCQANDPHGEHDFGSFDFDGTQIMFKIDYYDQEMTYHSPDPADPTKTKRVITVMLAEEY